MFERFESAKVRNLRLEHKREVCALRGEVEYYKAAQLETAHTAHFMAERMNKDYTELSTLRAEVKRLHQMLKISEETRKGIAEKYNALREQYDQLAADHEKLVYAVEHKEAEI
jgi:chromosome segregation ATPase